MAHGSSERRIPGGVHARTQIAVLVLSVLALSVLVGLAVLNWLEHLG